MPVDFLSDAQAARYGCYTVEPEPAQLGRYFYLDDADRSVMRPLRGDSLRLGFALQLGTVRFLGTFLADPTVVPLGVLAFVSQQLALSATLDLTAYRAGSARFVHMRMIQQHYGYRDFHDQPHHFHLVRWLFTRAWLSPERPSMLFDLATARLVAQKILLPGVSTLVRLIAQVRDRAAQRLWQLLDGRLTPAQRTTLDTVLQVPEGRRMSTLDRLRKAPTHISAPALVGALHRLEDIRALGVGTIDCRHVPPGRMQVLARFAAAARAQAIARMPDDRRSATLLAFAQIHEATAQDDALSLLDQLLTLSLARAERTGQRARLRTLNDLDTAAADLEVVVSMLLDEATYPDAALRAAVFARVGRDRLTTATGTVRQLIRPSGDTTYYELLANRYGLVRQFLPTLLRTITFSGIATAQPILDALRFLSSLEGKRTPSLAAAPRAVITNAWRRLTITTDDTIDRRFYTFCVLERLQDALSRRDIYVHPSERWGNPRAKLLQDAAWTTVRSQVCRTLGRDTDGAHEVADLTTLLDAAYQQTADNLPANTAVTISAEAGDVSAQLTLLDKLDEPTSLTRLQHMLAGMLPRIDLPDAVLDIHALTGFADAFTHLSEQRARADDLHLSICAVLIAEACNIGLEPVARADVKALTHERLGWVQQNYIRADTLTQANARLVDAQTRIGLAHAWGGGEVASADGLRFVVPVRTLNAGPNSKYFHVERGVTYYNFASNQFTGFHGIVIPGTVHEGPYLLEGLLEQQTSLQPREIMADTAAYSDIMFGLFHLLGYQFSPRLADIGETRFWRIDPHADYGSLQGLARHQINTTLIRHNWDDMLRVAGSLKLGTVRASDLLRTMQGSGKRSALARAIGELGKIAKTLYALRYLDDPIYRRRILTQLNRGEGRHRLARVLFHGQRGELRQRYREGQEDQLGALGLMVNIIVLWNTHYMDAALTQLRVQGIATQPADIARLSPLANQHIHMLGRYRFVEDAAILRGELRPFGDPNAAAPTSAGER
jgi:TnpA family transposase